MDPIDYFYEGTCGTLNFEEITEGNYNKVKDEKKCNPYYNDFENSSKSADNRTITCAFYRPFDYSTV